MSGDDFEVYFREHWLAVLQFVRRRVSDPSMAQEITQDCFMAALNRFDPSTPPPRTWLYRVAGNLVKKSYRRRTRDAELLRRLGAERPPGADDVAIDLVQPVLDELSHVDREVVQLYYWDELPAADIGQIVGLSKAAVWQRLSRLRQVLRARLSGLTFTALVPQ